MSKLEAARQGVLKLARPPQGESLNELKAELERKNEQASELEKELGEAKAEAGKLKQQVGESEQAKQKAEADVEKAKAMAAKEKAAAAREAARLRLERDAALKKVKEQEDVLKAADEKLARYDADIFSQYDAGCFHILRQHQLSVPEENRLTLQQMLDWKNADIFRDDLRALHPIIPYTETDLRLYREDQLEEAQRAAAAGEVAEPIWEAPPKAEENLLDMVRAYDARMKAEAEAGKRAAQDAPPRDESPPLKDVNTIEDLDFTINPQGRLEAETSASSHPHT